MPDKDHLDYLDVSVLGYANRDGENTVLKPKSLKAQIRPHEICNEHHSDAGDYGPQDYYYQEIINRALPELFNPSSIICAGDPIQNRDGICPGDAGKYCLAIDIVVVKFFIFLKNIEIRDPFQNSKKNPDFLKTTYHSKMITLWRRMQMKIIVCSSIKINNQ